MRLAAVIVLSAASFAHAQTGIIDQSSPHSQASGNGANFNAGATFLTWQQQIRPAISGQLEGIRITYTGPMGSSFRIAIRDGAAFSGNPVLFETTVNQLENNTYPTIFINMSSANYTQTAGSPFVMEVSGFGDGNTNTPWIVGNYVAPASGPALYSEPLFLGSSEFVPGWKLGFDTFVLARCSADYNSDGVADFFDYLDFVEDLSANDDRADFNHDGLLDFFDYLDFVQVLAAGC